MTTKELFDIIKDELILDLEGEIKYRGDVIKYEYDAFNVLEDEIDNHLEDVCYEDRYIIEDFLKDYDEFIMTEPEIHENTIYFYIEK